MLKKVASNTISQILSKVGTAIISIFLISSLTKYLSPEMYGQYNKIYNYLSIFTFLADLGLYTISVREISKDKNNAAKIIGNVMSLRLILGIGIIFLSLFIALFIPGYHTFVSLISIGIISVFSVFSLMNSSVLSLMQSFMKIEFSGVTFVLGKIVNLTLIFGVIFILYPKSETFTFDMAFILIMLSGLFGITVNFFLNFYYANKIVPVRFLFDFEYMKELFTLSLPNGIALFLSVVYFKVDIILLSFIETGAKADISIALYSLPMKIIEVLMVIGIFFLNSILPSLSEFFKNNNYQEINKVLKNSFKFLFSFSLFVLIFGLLFGKDMISIISTSDYLNRNIHHYTSYDALVIVLFVLLFYFISSLFMYIFIASKNEKLLIPINVLVTVVNMVGNLLLIPKYSFLGSAMTTLLSQILLFGLSYYFSKKIIKIDFDSIYIGKILLFSTALYYGFRYIIISYNLGSFGNIGLYGILLSIIFSFYIFHVNKYLFTKR